MSTEVVAVPTGWTPEAPDGRPCVVGIIGDSGSGKSTICNGLRALIGAENITDLKLDDYRRYTRAECVERGMTPLNPVVHDFPLMHEHLELLRAGQPIRNRSYDPATDAFGRSRVLEPREVVLVRGPLGFPTDELRAAYDLAVFLSPEPELLFRWKLRHDIGWRGRSEAGVLKTIAQHVLDAREYVLPQAGRADLVVRYELPTPDAPDAEVRTLLTLRREATHAFDDLDSGRGFRNAFQVNRNGDTIELLLGSNVPDVTTTWAQNGFVHRCDPDQIGIYTGERGERNHSAQLACVQVLIASLIRRFHHNAPERQPARG